MAFRGMLVLWLLLGGLFADDKADIAYLKGLLASMQAARRAALAEGNTAEASRLLGEIEEVEYVIAHLGTELVQPGAPSTAPGQPPSPSAVSVAESHQVHLEQLFEGPARDLLARLVAEAGVQIVEPLPPVELGPVRVSAGSYDGLALARALLLLAGVEHELVEPGSIVVIHAPGD